MYPNAPPPSNLYNHPKYKLLLQRGYTPHQIQSMLQQRQHPTIQPRQVTTHHGHHTTNHLPQPPTVPSIDQSVMFSFQSASNERRMNNVQKVPYTDYVPPRADIQLHIKPDKSSIEGILQDAYEKRQCDAFVPPDRTKQAPDRHAHHRASVPIHPPVAQPHQHHTPPRQTLVQKTPRIRAQQERRKQFEAELRSLHDDQETAYKLLGVSQEYTLRELAKNYRKGALKYHPDRLIKHAEYITTAQQEECKRMFERITKAYLYLIEQHNLRECDKPFYELRDQSRVDTDEQQQQTSTGAKVKLMDGDQFDVQLFNKLYDDNRLHEPTDEGYGDWLKESTDGDTSELFSSKFNLDVFNTTFDQLKRDNPHSEKQLAKRHEMGIVVQGDTTAFSTLGEDVVGDYGGATGGLHYSDLKDAHTTNATLIDTTRAQQPPTFRSVKEMEAHRSQISHTLSPAEAEVQSFIKEKRKHDEHARRERLEQRDQLVAQQHQRIQQQLLQ